MCVRPTTVLEAGLTALLVGCVVVTIVARHEADRLSDRHPAVPGRHALPSRRILQRAVCVAASLLVTSALVGLTSIITAPRDTAPFLLVNVLALYAGTAAWQSADRLDALLGASRAWVGGLVAAIMWVSVLLLVRLVLTR